MVALPENVVAVTVPYAVNIPTVLTPVGDAAFILPVTLPVTSPTNEVADRAPELELNVKLLPLLGLTLPVASVTKTGKQVVSVDSSATVIVAATPDPPPPPPAILISTVLPLTAKVFPVPMKFKTLA